MIWTTTPWTIPANLAIACTRNSTTWPWNRCGRGLIVAEDLVDACMARFGVRDFSILPRPIRKCWSANAADTPSTTGIRSSCWAEHVTLEAGTGCVHTAPGHGQEDYELGLKYGLEIYTPVDNRGRFTSDVEFFGGQFVFDANPNVIEKLREVGALVHEGRLQPLLSPLLALQEADHLPRHRAVVHLHGQERSAEKGAGGDRPGPVDPQMGARSGSTA